MVLDILLLMVSCYGGKDKGIVLQVLLVVVLMVLVLVLMVLLLEPLPKYRC